MSDGCADHIPYIQVGGSPLIIHPSYKGPSLRWTRKTSCCITNDAMRPANPFHRLLNYIASLLHGIVNLIILIPGTTGGRLFLAFIVVYLLLIRQCNVNNYRDPTSVFFDPVRGYQRHYSLARQREAEAYLENSSWQSPSGKSPHDRTKPKLCVGIATIARASTNASQEQEQYVRATIGSLLDGLDGDTERPEIQLVVLIAHTDPKDHPIYEELWLLNAADKVLTYGGVPDAQKEELTTWEREKNYVRKAIFDYTFVLEKCASTGAQWIAMVEDDTLAVKNWYPRAMAALEQADDRLRVQADGGETDWLYLRMFYTEEFLGWNSEEWPIYLFVSVLLVAGTAATLSVLRRLPPFRALVTDTFIKVTLLICIPSLIILYFLAGRQSVSPMLRPGVSEMPRFGCCAQGLIFSSGMAPKIITRLKDAGQGFVDQLIEAWANEARLVRWVVVPSLLQHIGAHSSKGDDLGEQAKWDRSVAEKIWNFGFEMYSAPRQKGT